jgi:hypothetical protein
MMRLRGRTRTRARTSQIRSLEDLDWYDITTTVRPWVKNIELLPFNRVSLFLERLPFYSRK